MYSGANNKINFIAACRKITAFSKKTASGAAADSFFASFLGSKKEAGNGGKASNTPTWKSKKVKIAKC